MAEMKREEKHPDDIKAGDEIILKAVDHHRVNVVAIERIGFQQKETRISYAHGKMGEVVKDERQHDKPAQRHRARSKGRLHVLFLFITHRTGATVLDGEADGKEYVEKHIDEEEHPDDPQERAQRAEMFRIGVDPIRPEENLQVAEEMADDERDQDGAGDRDDEFFAD